MSDGRPLDAQDLPEAAAGRAERHLALGEPLLAFDVAQAGLARWPGHLRLRQLQALALARSGDVERANGLLEALAREGGADTETLGMLARTHKDLALGAHEGPARAAHLAAGLRLYARAFEADPAAYYAGINAAAMAVLEGDLPRARGLARQVREVCGREAGGAASYWNRATLGEAALVLGETGEAAAQYAAAAALAGTRFGDLATTRRQARLLASSLGRDGAVADALAIPPVLVFTGHMIDQPGRPAPRFPPHLEGAVREALRERLAALSPVAAYGAAACGTDLLCLELARERGVRTHVVLPFPPAEFRQASVDFAGGDWGERFDRALALADSVTVTSSHRASGSAATFEYANLVHTGMGRLRAQGLGTGLRALAAWDPGAAGLAGGAASLVAAWTRQGIEVDEVLLPALRGAEAVLAPAAPAPPEAPRVAPIATHEMRSLLFADAVGYSQLSEDQVPGFIGGFLQAVADLNARTAHRFEHVETSGDGLYLVFGEAADAAHYALELSALTRAFDRQAFGLPASFDLRIAVHCGPVHCARDPVTGGRLYTGPHTSRAARIEPITPPGQVYASGAFAAVAAASGVDSVAMHYVGRVPLAKGYGTMDLYCLRPGR